MGTYGLESFVHLSILGSEDRGRSLLIATGKLIFGSDFLLTWSLWLLSYRENQEFSWFFILQFSNTMNTHINWLRLTDLVVTLYLFYLCVFMYIFSWNNSKQVRDLMCLTLKSIFCKLKDSLLSNNILSHTRSLTSV